MGELRKDPILERWVIIASERSKRPGGFFKEARITDKTDPDKCPFCPGHESMTPPEIFSLRDPGKNGWKTRVIPNKYLALSIDNPFIKKGKGMYDMMTNFGAHEVLIETPNHEKEAKDQSKEEIVTWLSVLQHRTEDLSKDQRFRHLLIFKNKGKAAGASLTHPHHQIMATPITPKRVREELNGAFHYYSMKERCIFCDIINQEKSDGERIVYENEAYISFCPFASRFPYEIWILPKTHEIDFFAKSVNDSLHLLAEHLKIVLQKLSGVLGDPDYNYIFHNSPNRIPRRDYWHTIKDDYHWHIELLPKLTTIAGFEWGTGFFINPLAPEDAAKELREAKI
ncbi:MAG: galactose-1-phosphate uridylyltransferase [bacterium]